MTRLNQAILNTHHELKSSRKREINCSRLIVKSLLVDVLCHAFKCPLCSESSSPFVLLLVNTQCRKCVDNVIAHSMIHKWRKKIANIWLWVQLKLKIQPRFVYFNNFRKKRECRTSAMSKFRLSASKNKHQDAEKETDKLCQAFLVGTIYAQVNHLANNWQQKQTNWIFNWKQKCFVLIAITSKRDDRIPHAACANQLITVFKTGSDGNGNDDGRRRRWGQGWEQNTAQNRTSHIRAFKCETFCGMFWRVMLVCTCFDATAGKVVALEVLEGKCWR